MGGAASASGGLGTVGAGQFLSDLPDMASRIGEAGRADSPRPVHRAIEQVHPVRGQFRAYLVDIVDADREDEPCPHIAAGNGGRPYELTGGSRTEEVDARVRETEHPGVLVLGDQPQGKYIPVKIPSLF